MNKNILVICLMLVLGVSLASAGLFTGNAVKDGATIDDSDMNLCDDSDDGVFSEISGTLSYKSWIGGAKTVDDVCNKKGTSVTEYYCNSKGKKASKTIQCLGGCVNGACVSVNLSCEVTEEGAVDETGKVFKNNCKGKTLTEYSCNGTTVKEETTECETRCSDASCVGICSETDAEDNKDVLGVLTLDGNDTSDECIGTTKVKQYRCENGRKKSSTVSCGKNRECVNGACKDIYASAEVVGNTQSLQEEIAALQVLIANLTARIEALETA